MLGLEAPCAIVHLSFAAMEYGATSWPLLVERQLSIGDEVPQKVSSITIPCSVISELLNLKQAKNFFYTSGESGLSK
jgi:MOSC domain-containing protein YiiM